ncbi:hypothetical protein [Paraburkholderia fungorum]|uniref:hypothetical protein n=1 Tax=Paraburkholderia fungorum TaxID=134537 RepID=UPI0016174EE3|nr:hypothetical protein [Paraburkholderia fungorum]MBB5547391.1 uncharacterized protein YjeT (DUF2065 family) [Paraburkholderia fungorum]
MSQQVTDFKAEIVTLGERATKLVRYGSLAGAAAALSAGLAVYFGLKAHWAVPAAVISSLDIPQSILAHISDAVPSAGDASSLGGSPLSGALNSMVSVLGGLGKMIAPLGFIVGVPMTVLSQDGTIRAIGKLAVGVGMLLLAPMFILTTVGGLPDSDSSAPQLSPRQVFVQAVDSRDTKWLRDTFAKPSTLAEQYVLAQIAVIDHSSDHLGAFAKTMSSNPEALQQAGLTPRPDVAYAIDKSYFNEPRSSWAQSYFREATGRVHRFKSWESVETASSGLLLTIALSLFAFGKSIRARLRRIDDLQQHTRKLRFSDLTEDQLVQTIRMFPGVNREHSFKYILDEEGNVVRREKVEKINAVLT